MSEPVFPRLWWQRNINLAVLHATAVLADHTRAHQERVARVKPTDFAALVAACDEADVFMERGRRWVAGLVAEEARSRLAEALARVPHREISLDDQWRPEWPAQFAPWPGEPRTDTLPEIVVHAERIDS